jgi:hypothetical protein
MHQQFDSDNSIIFDRPDRDEIISKDEILSLIIDLQVLTPGEINKKYFEIYSGNGQRGI